MSNIIIVGGAPFPQEGDNRTRQQALNELAGYIGGENNPDVVDFCGTVWDSAARDMNLDKVWEFNRKSQDITLLANTSEYQLADDFNEPEVANTLNASGNEVDEVGFIPFLEWRELFTEQISAASAVPLYYTIEFKHAVGKVRFEPRLGPVLSYPKVRLRYFSRVKPASGLGDRLAVPYEMDQAIFKHAVAHVIAKRRSAEEAAGYFADARDAMAAVERKFRVWPDYLGR